MDHRTSSIKIRVTPQEHEIVEQLALWRGLTISELVRKGLGLPTRRRQTYLKPTATKEQREPTKYRPVGVAEKRTMLEAAGEEWPIGSDGLPKQWDANTSTPAGGIWRTRGQRKALRDKRIEKGLCRDCSNHLDCESSIQCWSCLDKHKERNAFAY